MPNGNNSLRFDDCANVVSMVCDTAIMSVAPIVNEVPDWDPFGEKKEEDFYMPRTRYCNV
jgi:hypothetical protein